MKTTVRKSPMRRRKVVRRVIVKKRIIRKITWEETKNLITKSRMYSPMVDFTRENEYNINEFWDLIKKHEFRTATSKISWWNEFEDYLKKLQLPVGNVTDQVIRILKAHKNSQNQVAKKK